MVPLLLFQSAIPVHALSVEGNAGAPHHLFRPDLHDGTDWTLAWHYLEFSDLGNMAWDWLIPPWPLVRIFPPMEFAHFTDRDTSQGSRQYIIDVSLCRSGMGLVRASIRRPLLERLCQAVWHDARGRMI